MSWRLQRKARQMEQTLLLCWWTVCFEPVQQRKRLEMCTLGQGSFRRASTSTRPLMVDTNINTKLGIARFCEHTLPDRVPSIFRRTNRYYACISLVSCAFLAARRRYEFRRGGDKHSHGRCIRPPTQTFNPAKIGINGTCVMHD